MITPIMPPSGSRSTPKRPTPSASIGPEITVAPWELLRIHPTPVVALNRPVAQAMADGPDEGLRLLESLETDLGGSGPFYAAKADFGRTLGRRAEAAAAYSRATELATNEPERRFLRGRIDELGDTGA